jgi:hypothetical protein
MQDFTLAVIAHKGTFRSGKAKGDRSLGRYLAELLGLVSFKAGSMKMDDLAEIG